MKKLIKIFIRKEIDAESLYLVFKVDGNSRRMLIKNQDAGYRKDDDISDLLTPDSKIGLAIQKEVFRSLLRTAVSQNDGFSSNEGWVVPPISFVFTTENCSMGQPVFNPKTRQLTGLAYRTRVAAFSLQEEMAFHRVFDTAQFDKMDYGYKKHMLVSAGARLKLKATRLLKYGASENGQPFVHIDPNFKKWGLLNARQATDSINAEVYQIEDGMRCAPAFKSFSDNLSDVTLNFEQIKDFCKNHRPYLNSIDGVGFFLMLNPYGSFYVASTHLAQFGLHLYVEPLEQSAIWDANPPNLVVVPQLDPKIIMIKE